MRTAILALALGASGAFPANAAETILTFEGFACSTTNSGNVNTQCQAQSDRIGRDYGTTAGVTVTSSIVPGATGAGTNLFYAIGPASGSGIGVAGFNNSSRETASSILFTPTAGFELSILDFRYFRGTGTSLDATVEILDALGNVLFTTSGSGGTATANTAYTSGQVRLQFYTRRGAPVIDDLRFDVRAITAPVDPGAVPEPASWAMMIGGFGLVGGAMRKRSSLARTLA